VKKKAELRIVPQPGQSVFWHVGKDGEVTQALHAGTFDLFNGEGHQRAIYPPSNDDETRWGKAGGRLSCAYKARATFGNMLSAVAMLEKIIREPELRNRYDDVCHVGAVAGWLKLAKGIAQQNREALRLARLRLGGGSVRLDDDSAGGSYCEYAVSETQLRLQFVMAMFRPSAEVMRSPETQMAFYSESLRGIKGDVKWELPVLQTERLYSLVEMELREWHNSLPAALLPSTGQSTLNGIFQPDATPLTNDTVLFGMKIDEIAKTVKRLTAGVNRESVCTISNDEQWRLFKLIIKHNGIVAATEVRAKWPGKDERNRTVSRLRETLQKIQLTFEYEKGKHYVIKEFQA
jgi:hypothetical protein